MYIYCCVYMNRSLDLLCSDRQPSCTAEQRDPGIPSPTPAFIYSRETGNRYNEQQLLSVGGCVGVMKPLARSHVKLLQCRSLSAWSAVVFCCVQTASAACAIHRHSFAVSHRKKGPEHVSWLSSHYSSRTHTSYLNTAVHIETRTNTVLL